LSQDQRAVERCATSFALAAENPWGGRDATSAWLRLGAELSAEDASPSLVAACVPALQRFASTGTDAERPLVRLAQGALFEGFHRAHRDRARDTHDKAWFGINGIVPLGADVAAVPAPPFAREPGHDPDTCRLWAESVAAACAKRGIFRVVSNTKAEPRAELLAALSEIGATLVEDLGTPSQSEHSLPSPPKRSRFWPFG
jgi:hypothetical protein